MIDFLRAQNADILHLQEVYTNSTEDHILHPQLPNHLQLYEYLIQQFDFPYHVFGKMYDVGVDQGSFEMGNATFSKFPITDVQVVYTPGHQGFDHNFYRDSLDHDWSTGTAPFVRSIIDVNGRELTSINMHGVWGKDGVDNPRRAAMSQLVLEAVEGKELVLCSGDFNTLPETRAMQDLGKVMDNVFEGKLQSTFNPTWWKKATAKDLVVDYVFTRGCEILQAEMPMVDVSDHMPLVVEVEV